MIYLTANDRFDIQGKGVLYSIKLKDCENTMTNINTGDIVTINRKKCKIISIEPFMTTGPFPSVGRHVGFLVKEVGDE